MLIFVPIIFVTGLSASFAAQYYENPSCTDKCMETTTSYGTMERYLKCLSTCMSSPKGNHLKKRLVDDPERTETKIEEKLEIKKEERLEKRLPTGNMKQNLELHEKLPKINEFSKNFRKNKAIDGLLGSRKSQLNVADLKKKAELNVSNAVDGIKHKIHENINHLIDLPLMVARGLIQNGHDKIAADDDKRNLNKEVSSLNENLAPKSEQKDSDMATVSAKVKREVPDQYGYNMEASNQNRAVIMRLPAARPFGTTTTRLATPGQRATYVERLIGNNVYFLRRTAAGDNTRAGAQEKANGAFQDGDGNGNNQADNAAGLNAGDQSSVANTGAGTADIANRIQGPASLRKEAGNWEHPGGDRIAERAKGRGGLRIAYKSLTNGATERNTNVAVVPRNNVYRNRPRQAFTEGHAVLNDENPRNLNPAFTNSDQYRYTQK